MTDHHQISVKIIDNGCGKDCVEFKEDLTFEEFRRLQERSGQTTIGPESAST
jgi:hypothetical protein